MNTKNQPARAPDPLRTGARQQFERTEMFTNLYCHEDCPVDPGIEWQEKWTCICNDKCPACRREIEPYESQDCK